MGNTSTKQLQSQNEVQYTHSLYPLQSYRNIKSNFYINNIKQTETQPDEQLYFKKRYSYTQQQLSMTNTQLFHHYKNKTSSTNLHKSLQIFSLISIPSKLQNVQFLSKQILLKQIHDPKFSVLSYSIAELIIFSVEIIWGNLYVRQQFDKGFIKGLVSQIAMNYGPIAYHNFSHAFSLVQLNVQALELMPKFKTKFNSQQLFYVIISGLAHDLNHNGTNNAFQTKRKSQLSRLYNNESVLENMHINRLWQILRQNPQINFLQKSQNKQRAKQIITILILSTDITNQFKNIQQSEKKRHEKSIKMQNFKQRMFLMQLLFHACDLGNPALNFDLYISWAALVSYEFEQQVKLQKNLNLQITKNFQYEGVTQFYKTQIGFVSFIVLPLWKEVRLHLPQLIAYEKRIEDNIKELKNRLKIEEQKDKQKQ